MSEKKSNTDKASEFAALADAAESQGDLKKAVEWNEQATMFYTKAYKEFEILKANK